jgi:uncharacterized protein YciW
MLEAHVTSIFRIEGKPSQTLFTSKLDLELRKKLVKYHNWSIALYSAQAWTLQKLDQKYLESFEM